MAKQLRAVALVATLVVAAILVGGAQMRVAPLDADQGHVALGLALRHLSNAGIFMHATAHPDDENNGLLVMLNRGQGYRTTLATATRGNGGQNEIGPEMFEALGVLRTGELAALHRFDGAEQYFTRAVDFGFTIDIPETLEKWGRDEIVGDYVRLIRTIRPDVITAQSPTTTGPGQHAHHALTAILSHEAYTLAGDPVKFPEQIRDGLRPWQPKKFYYAAGAGACRVDLALYDALLGKTYSEIGTEARSMHKCQGQAQLLALPGPSAGNFQLAETTIAGQLQRDERSLFDNVDTTIPGLAQFAGARPPRELTDGLSAIASAVQAAQKRFDTEDDLAALPPLLTGLTAVRALRGRLRGLSMDEAGRFEIEFRLLQKEREFQQAILVANGVRVEALADDGVVVPGQPVRVSLLVANRGNADITLKQVRFEGFEGLGTCTFTAGAAGPGGPGGRGGGRGGAPAGRGGGRGTAAADGAPVSILRKDQIARCTPTLTVPANTRITEPYWHRAGDAGRYTFDADAPFGLPYRPTPFYVQVTMGFAGNVDVIDGLPVQYRYEGNIFSGEKRSDLLVVPALSVRVSPEIAILPVAVSAGTTSGPGARAGAAQGAPAPAAGPGGRGAAVGPGGRGAAAGRGGRGAAAPARQPLAPPASSPSTVPQREVRVTVVNDAKGPSDHVVKLELPAGWSASPAEQPVRFSREDESQTVRFQITPAPDAAAGEYHVKASVSTGGADYRRGFQVIEYPHIRRQHIYHDADVTMKVLDVRTSPNLSVGYIMGAGDDVPEAIRQIGARVEMLERDDLAWGDLSRFGTIVTGVRAYERREDLIANNSRLLDYVRDGGTLIVQYNRDAFNDAQYGPYPAVVTTARVTDETAPVTMLVPDHPIFNSPNRITDAAWRGWIQERGLQLLGERDSRYRDLVEMRDPFPNNPGVKRGALVETPYGKGHWVYVGLGIWRELSVGVDGAYQLLANLISLGNP